MLLILNADSIPIFIHINASKWHQKHNGINISQTKVQTKVILCWTQDTLLWDRYLYQPKRRCNISVQCIFLRAKDLYVCVCKRDNRDPGSGHVYKVKHQKGRGSKQL